MLYKQYRDLTTFSHIYILSFYPEYSKINANYGAALVWVYELDKSSVINC